MLAYSIKLAYSTDSPQSPDSRCLSVLTSICLQLAAACQTLYAYADSIAFQIALEAISLF